MSDEPKYIQLPPMTIEEITDLVSMCRLGASLINCSGLRDREACMLFTYQTYADRGERAVETYNTIARVASQLVRQSIGDDAFAESIKAGEEEVSKWRKFTDEILNGDDDHPMEYLH